MYILLRNLALLSFAGIASSASPGGYGKKCEPPLVWTETPYGGKCESCPPGTEYWNGRCRPCAPKCPYGQTPVWYEDKNKWCCEPVPPPPPPPLCNYGEIPVWKPELNKWCCEKKRWY